MDDYTDTPTKIRVFDNEDGGWAIDGATEDGVYTEVVWTHYDGEPMTKDQAISRAREFAMEHGWGALPIVEFSMGDADVPVDA